MVDYVPKTEKRGAGFFMVSEANGNRSREAIVVGDAADLLVGTILGKSSNGAISQGATTGNGNGTITLAANGPNAIEGDYIVRFISTASNSGEFEVENPNGDVIGAGVVGTAFARDEIN
jgi:hypothetical protein